MDKETTKMIPGDELHLTMLMAPYSLNLVTGQDRQHLLAFGRAAFDAGKNSGQATPCLHQIAEPVTAGTAVRAFRDYLGVHDGIKLGGQAMDDMALDLARIALDFKHLVESQHPDEAAVDALAALMKAKLAEKRAKGYGGWNDKTQCPQQRLSDMLRAHVDKGDPVDVANFCAMLSARGEGIAAAPQAVQAAVVDDQKASISIGKAACHQQAIGEATPAHPAEGVPASVIAGAVFDFAGYLTTLPHKEAIHCSEAHEAAPMVEAITEWCKRRNLTTDGAKVETWRDHLAEAPAHPAEGVPQDQERWCAYVAGMLGGHLGWPVDDPRAKALSNIIKNRLWCLPPAATQPAAQGMDVRDEAFEAVRKAFCKVQRYSFFLDSRGNVRRCADHCGNWVEFEAVHTLFDPQAVDAAIAAQAKQGGAA